MNEIKDAWSWHFSISWEISAPSFQEHCFGFAVVAPGPGGCCSWVPETMVHTAAFSKMLKAFPQQWQTVSSKLPTGSMADGPGCFVVPLHHVGGRGQLWDGT